MKNLGNLPPIPYPLTRRIRLTIMLSLIGLFFIISPVVLLIARGFRFDFETKSITHGGALSLETTPVGGTIFINDIEMKQKSPYKIPNIIPGNYHIKIEKEGYYPWEKDIRIESNQTTYLHDVDLFQKNTPEFLNLSESPVVNLLPTQNSNNVVFMTQNDQTYDVYSYDRDTTTSTLLTRVHSSALPQLEWSPDEKNIEILFSLNGRENLILLPLESPTVFQTHSFEKNVTTSLQWDTRTATLLFEEKNILKKLGSENQSPLFTLSTSTQSWFVNGDVLWESKGNILTATQNGKIQWEQNIGVSLEKIIHANEKRVLGVSAGKLFIIKLENQTNLTIESFPLRSWYFLKAKDMYYVWFDGELRVVNHNGDVTFINRFSSEIKGASELTPLGTLMIVTDTGLFTFHPNYFVPQTLLSEATVEQTSLYQKEREIYFLGTKGEVRGVWRIGF